MSNNKIVGFAILGAVGCLLGASLGEVWLTFTGSSGARQAVCLLIDCSGSMSFPAAPGEPNGKKLREVKEAASQFVQRQDLSLEKIAVVGFGSGVHPAARLGSDAASLFQAIAGLNDGGSTAMDSALDVAAAQVLPTSGQISDSNVTYNILLFTDGEPDNSAATLEVASRCREQKIRIVAVATGDADVRYLAQVTGDSALVFPAAAGNFSEGFEKADKAIHGSLVETSGVGGSSRMSLFRIAVWTGFLALGIAVSLILGQNLYLRRAALSGRDAILGISGGLAAGAIAGCAGQLLYLVFAGTHFPAIGQIIGWTILGALVGRGLALFVPNLEPKKSAFAGAIGGAAGAIVFLLLCLLMPLLGRLVGAATLGAFLGAMIALVEVAFRQAWLEIQYGSKEVITVSLGTIPVRIGSNSRACTVYARGARPLACQYQLENGKITLSDFATEKQLVVLPGHQRTIGNVRVIVRASGKLSSDGSKDSIGASPVPPPPPPPKKMSTAASVLPLQPQLRTPAAPTPRPQKLSSAIPAPQATPPKTATPKTDFVLPPPPPPRTGSAKSADGSQARPNPPPRS